MGWTRRANPKWYRKASGQRYPSEVMCCVNYDHHGNVKRNNHEWDWTEARSKRVKYANKQRRQAAKLQIAYELYEDDQWQEELWEQQCGWEDDELELPDWWYGIEDDYEYPEPEPEEDPYDPYWFDDWYGYDDHY